MSPILPSTTNVRRNIKMLGLLVIATLLHFITSAQTTSWKGLTTTWSSATNWTNGVPTATTDVIIGDANFTGSSNPSIQSTSQFKSITVGGGTRTVTAFINHTRTVENVTIGANGTFQMGKFTLTITGDWIRNGGTYTTTTSTKEIFNGTDQLIGGTATPTFKQLTINAGVIATFQSNFSTTSGITLNGTLIPSATTNPKYTGSISVGSTGIQKVTAALYASNYSANPTLSNGSTVEYAGTVNQTIESSISYKTLAISGSSIKTPEAALIINSSAASEGNIKVLSGTLDLASFTANRAATGGGSFSVEDGAILKIGITNTFPTNYTTRTLDVTSTVEYSGTNQTVTNLIYGNLIFSSSSGAAVKTFAAGAFTIAGNFSSVKGAGTSVSYTGVAAIDFQGSVNIGVSTTFIAGAFNHSVFGNWTNSGTFTNTSSTITFDGTQNQTITSTAAFNNITVNKASGKVYLATDLNVKILTFTKSSIVTGTYKVIIPNGGSIAGAGTTTGWVYGNLQKYFPTTGGSFEIGGNANYTPLSLTFSWRSSR